MANPSWFGPRLKQLREQPGLTQPELAERAQLSKGGVADLEQGRRKPTWETVLALCAARGVSPRSSWSPRSITNRPAAADRRSSPLGRRQSQRWVKRAGPAVRREGGRV
jgi:transcriptional regulator with XRE-family HTH domain